MKKKIFAFLTLIFFSFNLFAASSKSSSSSSTNPKEYSEDEFPQWTKDLRRAEIITLGSMPFVTMGVSLAYGSYLYFTNQISSFPNPLDKSTSSYTEDQQLKIVGISLGVSAVFGLTDFIVNLIKNNKKNQEINFNEQQKNIIVVPINENEAILKEENSVLSSENQQNNEIDDSKKTDSKNIESKNQKIINELEEIEQ